MNTHVLVAYATKHGATAEIANCIANVLSDAHLNVKLELADRVDDLTPYEAVVLGSAVYAGSWQKDAAHFLSAHEAALGSRQVWLFSSGPTGEEDAATTMHGWRFPEALQPLANHIKPHDIAFFHGEIDMTKLHFTEKLIVKAMNVQTGDYRDWDAIRAWAGKIALELTHMSETN